MEVRNMLVSAAEMLKKAKAGHYAVGQFNINNLEWTKAALLTAEECKSPIILGVSEGAGKYMTGFKTVAAMVKAMMEELNITVPVALHLDHGTYEGCYKCIKAGFSSIMFDGSHYPIEENVEKTRELAGVCKDIVSLILAGLLLFIVEVFLIPGISIAGIASAICLLYANYYAFDTLEIGRASCRERV